ncbi:MAG TPA: hypothetical protein VF131_08945 [Blastocatellia bacterium]|nr:hypothetical protein [Blastocatellia bacterium]
MKGKLFTVLILLTLLAASPAAGDEPEQVRRSEIEDRTFVAGELKITLKRFWAGSLLTRGFIEVRAENTSSSAVTFNPQRLSFVGKDGKQVNIRGRRQTGPVHPDDRQIDLAQPREVAPGAYVKELYELDGRVRLPAKLFYEGKELAVIVK